MVLLTNKSRFIVPAVIMTVINLFIINPLMIIFVWNVLVVYLLGVEVIGYVGAWSIVIIGVTVNNLFISGGSTTKGGNESFESVVSLLLGKLIINVIIVLVVVVIGVVVGSF